MKNLLPSILATAGFMSVLLPVRALQAGDADQMYDNFNKAFLSQHDSQATYEKDIDGTSPDKGWTAAEDIYVPEDVFFRRGDDATQELIRDLATTWLSSNPTKGWANDPWNDDVAWYELMLVRAYQATGNSSYLDAAKFGSDLVWNRGWDTTSNDGGIWENQSTKKNKLVISTVPNAIAACYIYQSSHDNTYFDRCKTIYHWIRTHLFDTKTGVLVSGIYPDGTLDNGTGVSHSGLFIDVANFLWEATGDENYYSDAKLCIDNALLNLTAKTDGLVISTSLGPVQVGGWLGRAAGNFIRDNQLWDTYYEQFVKNANAILENKSSKYGITWNDWAKPTPDEAISGKSADTPAVMLYGGAVEWLQYTPPFNPSSLPLGIRTIKNVKTGCLLTSAQHYASPQPVSLEKPDADSTQTQRWQVTTNDYKADSTYNLVNLHSWQALTADNDSSNAVNEDFALRQDKQQWLIESIGSGSYKIVNKVTDMALTGGLSSDGHVELTQAKYTGSDDAQKWSLDTIPAPKVG